MKEPVADTRQALCNNFNEINLVNNWHSLANQNQNDPYIKY